MKLVFVMSGVVALFSGCFADPVIANIPEASGICYAQKSDSLFVANDEGTLYQIDRNGKILKKRRLGHYDLEGVACGKDGKELFLLDEESNSIIVLNQKTLKIKRIIGVKKKYRDIKIFKSGKHGIEGITIDGSDIYLSNQSSKKWPKNYASVIAKLKSKNKKKLAIDSIIDHGFIDVAGLDIYKGSLYMVSDKQDLLIKYSLKQDKVLWSKKLPTFAQEGIAFDNKGFVYFADDDGAVLKYKIEKFGI